MPEYTHYAPGMPIWTDLGARDVPGAAAFYGRLFGWEAQDLGPQAGGYTMLTLRGKAVSAVGPLMSPDQPVAWSTYLGTDDVEATARRVREAGGTVVAEPMQVMSAGRMAVFLDATGAAVLAWEPGEHRGWELVGESGTAVWNELMTRDPARAQEFYAAAFGLGARRFEGADYTLFTVGDRDVAGMMAMGGDIPAEVPPHWLPYFGVDDVDAAAARVGELGGRTLSPAMDIPGVGRFAGVADDQGAAFAVFKGEPRA